MPKVTQLQVETLRFESRTEQRPGTHFPNYPLLLLLETEKEDEIQTLRRQARNTGGPEKVLGATGKAQQMQQALKVGWERPNLAFCISGGKWGRHFRALGCGSGARPWRVLRPIQNYRERRTRNLCSGDWVSILLGFSAQWFPPDLKATVSLVGGATSGCPPRAGPPSSPWLSRPPPPGSPFPCCPGRPLSRFQEPHL